MLRSIPWRLLLPPAVILIAAALTPSSELHSNQGDVGLYLEKARDLAAGQIPYRDFPFEYPPLALVPMFVPYILWPFGQASVESYAWAFVAWEAILLLGVCVLLARIVRLGGAAAVEDRDGGETSESRVHTTAYKLTAISVGAALAIAFRFDLFPAFLVVVALWAALERRPVAAGVAIGVGVLAKLFPIAVLPALAIPWLVPLDLGRLTRLGAAAAITIVLVMLPFVVLAGSDAFGFLTYQAQRGLQVESIGGGLVVLIGLLNHHPADMSFGFSAVQVAGPLADAWLAALPALTVLGFAVLGWIGWRRIRGGGASNAAISTFAFATVLVVLATSKVFSIQYVVWIVPFAALLPGRKFWLALALVALTMPIHPLLYAGLVKQEALPILILNVRNGLFLTLTLWVLRDLARDPMPVASSRLERVPEQ